ncbi:MAG: hypothetical protein KDA61_05865 [Planctomycetales bacterium]|nr:hypothetical protein [Planctomycetales bacterium]
MVKMRLKRLAIVLVGFAAAAGCGDAELSPAAYQFAQATYSICNLRATERLEPTMESIRNASREGSLTSAEADRIGNVISQAQDGDWEGAVQAVRALLESQVRDADNGR